MPPVPPRPMQAKKSEQYLSEKTLAEQQAGQEALKISKDRHQEEIDAGKKMIELNQQRAQHR